MHFGHVEFGKMELQLILTKQVCLFESMRKPPLAWKRFGFHPQSCAEIWTKGKNIPTVHRKWSCVFSSFKFTSKTHSHNGNSAPKMQKSSVKAMWNCTLLAAVITLSCSCHPVVERIPSVPLGYLGHCYALQGQELLEPSAQLGTHLAAGSLQEQLEHGAAECPPGFERKNVHFSKNGFHPTLPNSSLFPGEGTCIVCSNMYRIKICVF